MYASNHLEPEVEVDLALIKLGYHGIAYNKVKLLYPGFSLLPVWRCRYSLLGWTRYYIFSFKVNDEVKEANTAVETEKDE